MQNSVFKTIFLSLSLLMLYGCSEEFSQQPANPKSESDLTIYSGITMVRPLKEVVERFEKQYRVSIHIEQGASNYLYKTINLEKHGDIFLPGSNYYRTTYKKDGHMTYHKLVGFNRLALVTAKGNPKAIELKIDSLLDPHYSVVLPSPDSSSVGKAAENLLKELGIRDDVYKNVSYFTTDSHKINQAVREGKADIALNWYATTFWKESKFVVDAVIIDPTLSKPKQLELNLLSFSKKPELARRFIDFATRPENLESFHKYGFLTDNELAQLNLEYKSTHQ